MTEKEKRQMRHKEEDVIFNRMLLWMAGVIVAEAVVLFVKRFYIDITARDFDIAMAQFLSGFFGIFMYAGCVLTIAGIVWCALAKKSGRSTKLPTALTAAVAFIWVLSLFSYVLSDVGVKVMMVLPIVAAVLILIYFLYQRVFFVNTVLTGFGMAGLWCFRQFYDAHTTFMVVMFVLGWVVLAAIAVLAYVLKKHNGKLGKCQVVTDHKSYAACWLTCAVVAAATILTMILGSGYAFYLIYVLIGWLFCLAVYYTVKLI